MNELTLSVVVVVRVLTRSGVRTVGAKGDSTLDLLHIASITLIPSNKLHWTEGAQKIYINNC